MFRVINTTMPWPRKWKTIITATWCIDCLTIILTMPAVGSLIPQAFGFLSNREVDVGSIARARAVKVSMVRMDSSWV